MNIFIFSTFIISIIFLCILGSWRDINGPVLSQIAFMIAAAVAIFSVSIVIATRPINMLSGSRSRKESPHLAFWSESFSTALSTPAAVLEDHKVRFANTPFLQALDMVNMTDQILGMPFSNLIHPADHHILAELIAEANLDNIDDEPKKIRLLCADGTTLPSHATLTRMKGLGQSNQILFQFTPISELSPLSSDFENQYNYHSIVDRLEEVVFQLSAEGKILFLNPAWQNLLDYRITACLQKPLIDFFHPEDKPIIESRLNALTQGKRSNCRVEGRLISFRGETQWVLLRAKATSLSKGERTSVVGTITDISRTKEAEAQLLANRRALNSLLSNIAGMVYRGRNDRSWTFEFVSDGCIDITGYDPVDLIDNAHLNYNMLIHPDDRAKVWHSVQQQLAAHEKFQLIYRIISRNGQTTTVLEHGRGIFSSTGELLALEGLVTAIPTEQYSVIATA